jgi:hypothetical protein
MTPDQLMAREALILRLRLEFGFASPEEVELWADAWLLALEKPSHEIVDLALATQSHELDVLKSLVALGGEAATAEDVVRALAAGKSTVMSVREIDGLVRRIAHLAVELDESSIEGKFLYEAYVVWDLFPPGPVHRSSEAKIRAAAQAFLARAADLASKVSSGEVA